MTAKINYARLLTLTILISDVNAELDSMSLDPAATYDELDALKAASSLCDKANDEIFLMIARKRRKECSA